VIVPALQHRLREWRDFLQTQNAYAVEIRSELKHHRCLDIRDGTSSDFNMDRNPGNAIIYCVVVFITQANPHMNS